MVRDVATVANGSLLLSFFKTMIVEKRTRKKEEKLRSRLKMMGGVCDVIKSLENVEKFKTVSFAFCRKQERRGKIVKVLRRKRRE